MLTSFLISLLYFGLPNTVNTFICLGTASNKDTTSYIVTGSDCAFCPDFSSETISNNINECACI